MRMIEKIREKELTDPIIKAAFKTYDNDFDAICAALLAHVDLTKGLLKELLDIKMEGLPPIVVTQPQDSIIDLGDSCPPSESEFKGLCPR